MLKTPTRRRSFLAAAIGTAAAGSITSSAAPKHASAASGIEQNRMRTFMLMRGALDGQLVIGYCSGAYYGVINGAVTPHFGFVSATFARYRHAADGGYEGATYEMPYFTDLDTGEVLHAWKNPITGEILPVPQPHFVPTRIRFAPDLAMEWPGVSPGVTMNHGVAPASVIGDNVWLMEKTFVTFKIPHVPQPGHFTEIVTMLARLSDLENAHATRVPTITYYEGIGGWRPWQKMGDRPGSLVGNGHGRYGVAMDDLPPDWLSITHRLLPKILQDPSAPLAPLLAEK